MSAAVLCAGGATVGLYGLVALLYRGEGRNPGPTYVGIFGHRVNAHVVGAIGLAVGLAVGVSAIRIARRRPAG